MIWIILYALSCLIAWPLFARLMAWDWKRSQSFPRPLDRDTVVFCISIGGLSSILWPLFVVGGFVCYGADWVLGKLYPFLRRTLFRGIDVE